MTIDEVKTKIKFEIDNKIPSRFPLRLIFANNMEDYGNIKHFLIDNCEASISLGDDDICETEDIYPNFAKLKSKISQYRDKPLLLLAMGEYFRFALKRELSRDKASFPSFFRDMQDVNSGTKVFVLLFAANNLFDQIIPIVDSRQKEHIWSIDSTCITYIYNIFVFSDQYRILPDDYTKGLKSWLNNWEMNLKKKNNIVISTRLLNNVVNSSDIIDIKVITNIFDYICTKIDNPQNINRDWLTDEQWEQINNYIKNETDFNKVILKILNTQIFDQYQLFAQWSSLSDLQKQLILTWYKLNQDNSYCAQTLKNINNTSDIIQTLRDYILNDYKENWVKERNIIISSFKDIKYDSHYFELLNGLKNPEKQLALLSYTTHEERMFALKIISGLLRDGMSHESIQNILGSYYPLFQQYFFDESCYPLGLKAYFRWYKYNKIINLFPLKEFQIPDFASYNARFGILQKYVNDKTFIIWVDGMGIEWLSLLYGQIKETKATFSIDKPLIVKSILPTETEYNRQWDDFKTPYEKIDKLDNLNHKGIPDDNDYFSCIDTQFGIMKEIAQKAISYLQDYERVIITADHGSSRLAALAFHHKPGFKAPEDAKPMGHGRFCELPSGYTEIIHADDYEYVKIEDKAYYVIKNHEHYSVSGKALSKDKDNEALCGEIHGGKTPEEYLVPIIIINRNELPQVTVNITFSPEMQIIYKTDNVTKVQIKFNNSIEKLQANIGNINGNCKKIENDLWEIEYNGLDNNKYKMELIADGHLLANKASFEVKARGISETNYFGDL